MNESGYNKTVIFKVTEYQRALLDLASARMGCTISDFLRSLIDASTDALSVEAHNLAMSKLVETGHTDPVEAALAEMKILVRRAQAEALRKRADALEVAQ